jgi:hypothetical protein
MKLRLFVTVLAGLGCMANGSPASDADDFDRAVAALGAGASSHPASARRLHAAGATLAAIGARPIETEDLALAWQQGAPAVPLRGRALGPAYRRMLIEPRGSLRLEQTFLAGQRAQIEIVAWDHASFQLEVRDDEGKAVCMISRVAKCKWLPAWTTRYQVHLSNPGARAGTYFLVIQ